MENRYSRNRIYISNEEQEILKHTPILLGGAGIGSAIAECLLRLGFETLTLIDGDVVEVTNLNRQNYTEADVSRYKAEAIKERLLAINSKAQITTHTCYLTPENVEAYIGNHAIAINALDFTSDVPLLFDTLCRQKKIPVLHPYNLGWGALVMVISETTGLEALAEEGQSFNELHVVQHVTQTLRAAGKPMEWLEEIIRKYIAEEEKLSPPQLSVASWLVAGLCAQIAYTIAVQKPVKYFPEFYVTAI